VHSAQLLQKLLEPFPLFGMVSIVTNALVAFTEAAQVSVRSLIFRCPGFQDWTLRRLMNENKVFGNLLGKYCFTILLAIRESAEIISYYQR
jgi:hypothetical protein